MRFSVIIPVYNAAKTLLSTLNSVKDQTFTDFEIIVVNDGSTDDSEKVIDAFFKVHPIPHRYFKITNHGVSYARNLGIENASGDYLCFLDSDDLWHGEKLHIVSTIIKDYSAEFVGHPYTVDKLPDKIVRYDVDRVTIFEYLQRNLFQTSCVCAKKELLHKFDESMSHSEDYDLFLDTAGFCSNVYRVNAALTRLGRPQLSKGGLSQNRLKMRLGEMKVYRKFCLKHKRFLPLLPLLLFWSSIKHVKSILKRR
jgi:glycosyltransferase involved in cell wall biosynthesis